MSGSHSPLYDKALPYSAVFPAICQTNGLSKERDDIQFRLQKAQRSSNILTKDQLEALLEMIESGDYTKEENKLVLINTFVNSVLVYDNGDVYITLNCRGTDGLFLKSEAVRLQSGSVHH